MDNRILQRLVAQNAQFISNLHFDIEGYVLAGKHFKSIGERSFAEHQYKLANKARSRLAPAVSTQLTLKAEIRWNDHVARLNKSVGLEEQLYEISSYPPTYLTDKKPILKVFLK